MNSKLRECDGLTMLGACSTIVGIEVALLEEVCHCGYGVYDTHPSPLEASFQPQRQKLSTTRGWYHVP